MRVLITGAGGNLGAKLTAHLRDAAWCGAVTGLDIKPIADGGKVRGLVADLRDAHDRRWIDAVEAADAIVHLAAQNAAPDSDWQEAAQSFDMTANLLEQAGRKPACRLLFASSNHAMGGYKDAPLPEDGILGGATPPLTGTRFFDGTEYKTSSAYGSSKLMGERATIARARGAEGRLTAVILRIGWAQRGENLATTLGAHGVRRKGALPPPAEEEARGLRWFRNMWLSNRDFLGLCEAALRADAAGWPEPAIVVSGMSNNTGMAWDLETGRRCLGFMPVDDVWAEVGA